MEDPTFVKVLIKVLKSISAISIALAVVIELWFS
jgi:hypothetical protein